MRLSLLPAALCVLLLLDAATAFAQNTPTLPNLSFETWMTASSGRYKEPDGGVWATPNPTLDILLPTGLPPAPTQQTTDAHAGASAVYMKTGTILGQNAAGTLFTGKFSLNISNPAASAKLGTPFNGRPARFKGWYKSHPVNGDSATAYIRLTRKNITTGQRELVGKAALLQKATVSTYTQFDLPITYFVPDAPDTIVVVFTSSAGGANPLAAKPGSEMWIDDVTLEYPTGTEQVMLPELAVRAFPNPSATRCTIVTERALTNGKVAVMDALGRVVMTAPIAENTTSTDLDVSTLPVGGYWYTIYEQSHALASGNITVQR